ncbi:leucine zipper putative tumor suppressor 3-like [Clupea harengus]|uniref:Leucine zipper putative tumor suppressor 3-like n=1 Tax=Clupea harengus TaxID=7950 RepID=A0A8M1KMS5_CLUHA|nr:leucine zipper putative tumor suppressor 3-like [Clupea harengus]
MGSAGSGVANHQSTFAMRSVGTRTTTITATAGAPNTQGSGLSRGPSLPPGTSTRRRLDDRSYSAERPPHPANALGPPKTGGPPGDERSYGNAESSYYGGGTEKPPPQPDGAERLATHTNANRHLTNGERMVANTAFLNGLVRRDGHHDRGRTSEAMSGPGSMGVDICGNSVALNNDKNSSLQMTTHFKDNPNAKLDNHKNPPNILPVSGKLEQNDGLVRPSAFKPVVPKSFHSMQNLVSPAQKGPGGGRGGGSGGGGGGGGGKWGSPCFRKPQRT